MRATSILFILALAFAVSCRHQPSDRSVNDSPSTMAGGSPEQVGKDLVLRGRLDEAVAVFRQALPDAPSHRRPFYLEWIATCHLAQREEGRALAVCEEIERLPGPTDRAIPIRLKAYRRLGRSQEGLELCLNAAARGKRLDRSIEVEVRRHHAYFLGETGEIREGIERYERLLDRGVFLDDLADHLRLLYVRCDRHLDAIQLWRDRWQNDRAFEKNNLFVYRFKNVDRLAQLLETLSPPSPELLYHLGRAYLAIGWIEEARATFDRSLLVEPSFVSSRKMLDRLDRFSSFIDVTRGSLYTQYRTFAGDRSRPSLEQFVSQVAHSAREHGFEIPPDEIDDLSLVHHYLAPHVGSGRNLPAFFRRWGLHLVLFDVFGSVEGNLKRIVSLDPRRRRQIWGRSIEYEIALCESSVIYHHREFLGDSSFGGLAIGPHGFWLDLDTYRRIARQIATQYRRVRSLPDGFFAEESSIDRRPIDAIHDSPLLRRRLAYHIGKQFDQGIQAGRGDLESKITAALLETAEFHEAGHLVIERDYLPISHHPLRAIGLAISEGFQSDQIAAWSEEQAQLTALAHGSTPHLSLYRTVAALDSPSSNSRHARGYRRILRGFIEIILDEPEKHPTIRTDRPIFEQLHRLRADEIRSLARSLHRG